MKKHFLLLLMAFFSLASWAADLDETKFVAKNVSYGIAEYTAAKVTITGNAYVANTDFEYDFTQFYGSNADESINLSTIIPAEELATATAGKYYFKITGIGDYEGQTKYVSFWIIPAKIFITFTADQKKTYGADDPEAFDYTLTDANENELDPEDEDDAALIASLELTIGREEGENAGEYDYTYEAENENYALILAEGSDDTFEIEAKEITGAIVLGDETLTYNGSDQAPTITIKESDAEDAATVPAGQYTLSYTYSAAEEGDYADTEAHANAGWYKVTVSTLEDANYTFAAAITSGAFQIAQAPLQVYVNSLSRDYDGTTDIYYMEGEGENAIRVEPTIAYSGLVGDDATTANPFDTEAGAAFVPAYVAYDDANKNVGEYSLTVIPTENVGGNIANYDVNYLNTGKLTITAKAIAIKPFDSEKEIDADDPEGYSGIDLSEVEVVDDVEIIAGAYKVVRTNDAEAVDVYEDVLALEKLADAELGENAEAIAAVKTVLANYTIDATGTADFEITGGILYVYPKSTAIVYGDPTPTTFEVVAATAAGTEVEIDKPNVIFKDLDAAPTAAGTYVLALDAKPTVEGYNVVTLEGQYTISPKPITVTVQSQILQVGDDKDALVQTKVNFAGKLEGDVIGYTLDFNDDEAVFAEDIFDADGKLTAAADRTSWGDGIMIVAVASTEEAPNDNANYTIDWTTTGELVVGGQFFLSFESENADWDEIVKYDGESADIAWAPNRNQPLAKFDGDWKAGEWNTGILPFAVTPRELSNAFGYAIVNVADPDKTTETNVAFKLNMLDEIPANTPFAIKTDVAVPDLAILPEWDGEGEPDDEFNTAFAIAWDAVYANFDKEGGFTIEKPESQIVETEVGDHKFVGVYKEVKMDKTKSNCHFMVNGAWKHLGASSTREFTILPFNCYIESPADAAARGLTFTFEELDGTTTAIKAIAAETSGAEANAEGWYTIGGMKLQGVPAQKGVYINNGKKVVIK